jgi:hypothetical protein
MASDPGAATAEMYDPVHDSGPGEIVFLAVLPTAMIREPLQLVQGTEQVLPTAMIRYVVVVLAR